MTKLTKKQQEILNFMNVYLHANDGMPTTRVIQKRFGFTSTNGAKCHIRALIKKGYLEYYTPGRYRRTRTKEGSTTKWI